MAARYATTTLTIQLAPGASHLVVKGALRDSAHPAVVAQPGLFTTTAPVAGKDVSANLWNHLQAYPAGTEL